MKRREFLATLGSISGTCFGDRFSRESTLALSHRISLENQDSVPDQFKIQITAEIVEHEFTENHPARVKVTITNTGLSRELSVGTRCDIFNKENGGSDPAGLWLHTPGREKYDRKDDRWVADRSAEKPRGYSGAGCPKERFYPGESASAEYVVWDDYRVDGYLNPGEYRWEQTVYITDGAFLNSDSGLQKTPPNDAALLSNKAYPESGSSFSWGFSLSLHEGSVS